MGDLLPLSHYHAKLWNKTETKFIKQNFRMLFLPHQCNLSCLGKLSQVKWIASNCGWPTSKQNRPNQLIRDRLYPWKENWRWQSLFLLTSLSFLYTVFFILWLHYLTALQLSALDVKQMYRYELVMKMLNKFIKCGWINVSFPYEIWKPPQ